MAASRPAPYTLVGNAGISRRPIIEMTVMVDGNNLLHAAADAEPERPPGRTQLCQRIGAWASRYRHAALVFFDGAAPDAPRAAQLAAEGVEMIFSGAVTADEALIERLNAHSAPRQVLVVSSDREIRAAARRRRAVPVPSAEFWRRLERDLSRPRPRKVEPPAKREGLSADELDQWLDEFRLD